MLQHTGPPALRLPHTRTCAHAQVVSLSATSHRRVPCTCKSASAHRLSERRKRQIATGPSASRRPGTEPAASRGPSGPSSTARGHATIILPADGGPALLVCTASRACAACCTCRSRASHAAAPSTAVDARFRRAGLRVRQEVIASTRPWYVCHKQEDGHQRWATAAGRKVGGEAGRCAVHGWEGGNKSRPSATGPCSVLGVDS